MFLIDRKGILRQITVNDRPVGRSVDEAIRLLDAFIFFEKHGEVCPANWKPNSATIKPDPVASLSYFSSVHWGVLYWCHILVNINKQFLSSVSMLFVWNAFYAKNVGPSARNNLFATM